MSSLLSPSLQRDFLDRGFSRRSFGRIAALLGAGSALPFFNESALAQRSYVGEVPPDAVLINANENPLGPCPEALQAMTDALRRGGRYGFGETFRLANTLADQEGLKPEYVQAFAGSSDPLHRVVMAFTSPSRPLIVADPGYEAGERAADFIGAKTIKVPLTKTHAHDVKAMLAASPNAGVYYICNPNNPTGTVTPRKDLEWLLKAKPEGSVVLLDEAYIHFSSAQACTDWVAQDRDVIVLRTFSKLYGMAGLRAGAALARPDLLAKLRPYGTGFLPLTGMVGATASLTSSKLIAERRRSMTDIRQDVLSFLSRQNYQAVPSESNCFMLDVRRPGREFVAAMAKEKVYVGRVWSAWPNHVRITVGTHEEMAKFKTAFTKVTA